jgi:hypothetical protein
MAVEGAAVVDMAVAAVEEEAAEGADVSVAAFRFQSFRLT